MASECFTTMLLAVFTQRNSVADFLQVKCNYTQKKGMGKIKNVEGKRWRWRKQASEQEHKCVFMQISNTQ